MKLYETAITGLFEREETVWNCSTDQLIYWYTDQGQNVAWRIVRDTPYPGENSRYNTFKFSEAGTDEYHQDDFFEIPDAAKYTL